MNTQSNSHSEIAQRLEDAQEHLTQILVSELQDRIANLDLDGKIVLSTFHKQYRDDFTEDMDHIYKSVYLENVLRRVRDRLMEDNMICKLQVVEPTETRIRNAAISYVVTPYKPWNVNAIFKTILLGMFSTIVAIQIYQNNENMSGYFRKNDNRIVEF